MKWVAQTNPEEVTPIDDLRPHGSGVTCWCKPFMDDHTIVHNAMDKREEYERGRKPS